MEKIKTITENKILKKAKMCVEQLHNLIQEANEIGIKIEVIFNSDFAKIKPKVLIIKEIN